MESDGVDQLTIERYRVCYLSKDTHKDQSLVVYAMNFSEASLIAEKIAEKSLNAEIKKIVHHESGLEESQLDEYRRLQENCYEARWFGYGDEEGRRKALKKQVDFEYFTRTDLEYVNKIQEQNLIPPYDIDVLPSHLKQVVKNNSRKG